uniref:Gem-associated protein 8 n=1 Tax=Caenorhabditis tropicalis TaxID=1561998 RepID=A0A1I7TA32_9PELO
MNSFFENNEWARDPSFNHFWKHYEICDQWIKQHNEATQQGKTRTNFFAAQSNNDEFDQAEEPEVTERLSRCEIRNEDENEETEVMSEEMKEFFAKTQDHRQKLKLKREAEKHDEDKIKQEKKQMTYINVGEITVRGRVEHSTDHRDANAEFIEKREKAKKDYGDAAPKILAMESALEMKFESEYASHPQMWPNIPFRF